MTASAEREHRRAYYLQALSDEELLDLHLETCVAAKEGLPQTPLMFSQKQSLDIWKEWSLAIEIDRQSQIKQKAAQAAHQSERNKGHRQAIGGSASCGPGHAGLGLPDNAPAAVAVKEEASVEPGDVSTALQREREVHGSNFSSL